MMAAFFAALGLAAGALHAVLLGRAVGRAPSPLSFALRMGGAAAVLVLAAALGHPLAAAAGWAVGFGVGAVVVWWRLPR